MKTKLFCIALLLSVVIVEAQKSTSAVSLMGNLSANAWAYCDTINGNGAYIGVNVTGGDGGYRYKWSEGDSVQFIYHLLSNGTYIVTVTDTSGNTTTSSVTTNCSSVALGLHAYSDCDTSGLNGGSVHVTAHGGNDNYTYSWSMGSKQSDVQNLANGSYSVTVVDAMGSTATTSVIVVCSVVGKPLSVNAYIHCDTTGMNMSQLTANGNGGALPYNYIWSTGSAGQYISNVSNGTYTLSVVDALNDTASAIINVNCVLTPLTISHYVNCDTTGLNGGNVSVSCYGGKYPYTYYWSNGASGTFLSNLANGVYTVTVIDANNDSTSISIDVSCSQILKPLNVYANTISCDTAGGHVVATAGGGILPYTYFWSAGSAGKYLNNVANGSYTVTVVDANSNTSTGACIVNCYNQKCSAKFYWYTDTLNAHTIIIDNESVGEKQIWDLGDGTILTGAIGTHIYAGPGSYNVCLHVRDSLSNCSDTMCMNLNVAKTANAIYQINIIKKTSTGIESSFNQQPILNVYPVPVTGITTISYVLSTNSTVSLEVYNMLGSKVADLVNRMEETGTHKASFNAQELNAGIYLVKLSVDGQMTTTRIVVAK